ncbi:MAG: flagellar hook-length control protein FliK, partial [Vulcanimicrobiaceae bacterium]
ATVGRPAAMALSGMTELLPANASSSAPSSATEAGAAPVSGSAGGLSEFAVGATSAPVTSTVTPTAVFAPLASSDREPERDFPTTSATIGAIATASIVPPASGSVTAVPLSSTTLATSSPAVGVTAADGSNQPLGNALGSQVLAMIAAGRNQVTVHLNPPNLGTLTVHVEVQSHDVSAWFASPQPQVQQAVGDALAQLNGALSGAGLNLVGAWVGADVSGGNGRPAATPLPLRRAAPVATVAAEPVGGGVTPAEGLSVYA